MEDLENMVNRKMAAKYCHWMEQLCSSRKHKKSELKPINA